MNSYPQQQIWSDFRIGLIAFAGLLFLIFGILFAGGDKGILFQKTSAVKALLSDVGGLKKGASVTMNGMTVGKVTEIRFLDPNQARGPLPEGYEHNQIEVTMEIRSDVRRRVKNDSLPAVRTQGMLGDRYVDIPAGSESGEPLAEGKVLIGSAATDFDKTLSQALEVLNETEKMLSAVNEQKGTAGQLVYSPEFYQRLMDITKSLDELLKDFKKNPRRYIKFSLF